MTPGDDTKSMIASEITKGLATVRRDVADVEQQARAQERLLKERRSTHLGWGLFIVAAFVVVALTLAHIFAPEPPDTAVTLSIAGLAVLLAFGGGALVQGVRLDKILTAWRKDNAA